MTNTTVHRANSDGDLVPLTQMEWDVKWAPLVRDGLAEVRVYGGESTTVTNAMPFLVVEPIVKSESERAHAHAKQAAHAIIIGKDGAEFDMSISAMDMAAALLGATWDWIEANWDNAPHDEASEVLAFASRPHPYLVGQMVMNMLRTSSVASGIDFPRATHDDLFALAKHMGPDWCQALYHAAVFMTRNC